MVLARYEEAKVFALDERPLVRATLVRLGEDDHALLLTIHHIAFDGASMELFARELSALYSAAVAGAPHGLPELPVQYTYFTRWQREHVRSAALRYHVAGWKRELCDTSPLELPTDHPRPAV